MFSVTNYPHFTANEKTWLVTGVPFCHGHFSFVKVKEISIIGRRWAISVCAMFECTKNRELMYSIPQGGPNNEPLPCLLGFGEEVNWSYGVSCRGWHPLFCFPPSHTNVDHFYPPHVTGHPRKRSIKREWHCILSPQTSVTTGPELVRWLRRKHAREGGLVNENSGSRKPLSINPS